MAEEPVRLTDPKGRSHIITLRAGASFHTHRGTLSHDDIIGGPDRNVIRSGDTAYVVFRPLVTDYTLTMKRGAAVVYPKDAAQIVTFADVFPGARVL
jgi:tRNA (adenine57-N1/adenine58-N1)-methyltransferase